MTRDSKDFQTLLAELQASATDLARLAQRVVHDNPSVVVVASRAVSRWEHQAPHAWTRVREWLVGHGVGIELVDVSSDVSQPRNGRRLPQSANPRAWLRRVVQERPPGP